MKRSSRQRVPGKGNSTCKGPEVRSSSMCWKERKKDVCGWRVAYPSLKLTRSILRMWVWKTREVQRFSRGFTAGRYRGNEIISDSRVCVPPDHSQVEMQASEMQPILEKFSVNL